MPTTWAFVDRPEASPTVLLDMEDRANGWKVSGEGFDVSPPALKRSIAQNTMTDGGVVTAASYELRELRFTLELFAATEDGRNQQLKELAAELSKPANLLMYQAEGSSHPVFFRTLRSDNWRLDNQFIPEERWKVECSVMAEPYAIGVRHDIASGVVITNNPASGTNPTYYDITGVRGDSPSPAFARFGNNFGAGATFMLAQRSVNNPAGVTVWAQCEGGTMGASTTTQANDATMSGSGNNFARCTFASNNLETRVTVTVPTASSVEALRGRYRVLVKVRRSASTSAFALRYRVAGDSAVVGPQITYDTGMSNTWMLDLGVVEFPSPGPVPITIGYSGLSAGYATQALEIQAIRTTGALNLDFDYVYLLPADERMCAIRQVTVTGTNVIDGPNDLTYGAPATSSLFGATVADRVVSNAGGLLPRIGGLPMLVPGETNRWYILRMPHDVTATSTWDISYWPRWREVATS